MVKVASPKKHDKRSSNYNQLQYLPRPSKGVKFHPWFRSGFGAEISDPWRIQVHNNPSVWLIEKLPEIRRVDDANVSQYMTSW